MKNLVFILSIAVIVGAIIYAAVTHESKKESYIVVGKEYRQGGLCHDENRENLIYMVAHRVQIVVVPHVHHHKYEPSEFIIHYARPHKVDYFKTDSFSFYNAYTVGQKLYR